MTEKLITLYMWDRNCKFKLGEPYLVVKPPRFDNKPNRRWTIYAHRRGVSAKVIEVACSHTFKTKRDTLSQLAAFRARMYNAQQ